MNKKCSKCGSEWNSNIESAKCPFCGVELNVKMSPDKFNNIGDVLKYIVDEYGVELYHKPSLLMSYIKDLAPQFLQEERLLRMLIPSGIFEEIFNNRAMEENDIEIFINKFTSMLINDYYINENAASNLMEWLAYSVGWSNDITNINKKTEINKDTNYPVEKTEGKSYNLNNFEFSTEYIHSFDGLLSKPTCRGFIQAAIDENGRLYIDGEFQYETFQRLRDSVRAIQIQTGDSFIVIINTEGKTKAYRLNNNIEKKRIEAMSNHSNIVQIQASAAGTMLLDINGNVKCIRSDSRVKMPEINWKNMKRISLGAMVMAGLTYDGKISYAQWYFSAKYDISRFVDLIDIACGNAHIVGVKKDGTCVATGSNSCGQCNIGTWSNIVAVFCGGEMTIGITKKGDVCLTGEYYYGYDFPSYNLNDDYYAIRQLKNMVSFQIYDKNVIGLDRFGKLYLYGLHYRDVNNWPLLFSNEKNVILERHRKLFSQINKSQKILKDANIKSLNELEVNLRECKEELNNLSIFKKKRKQELAEKIRHMQNEISKKQYLDKEYQQAIENSNLEKALQRYFDC